MSATDDSTAFLRSCADQGGRHFPHYFADAVSTRGDAAAGAGHSRQSAVDGEEGDR